MKTFIYSNWQLLIEVESRHNVEMVGINANAKITQKQPNLKNIK